MVATYFFPLCWLHVDEEGTFLHTAFPDGRKIESVPNLIKDGATASAYGYGNDVRRLWREHDVLHHLIGTFFGHGCSPTIWSVAHEDHPAALPHWSRLHEEEFVGHVHRWLNGGEWHEALWSLEQFAPTREELFANIHAVLRGELLDARIYAPVSNP